MTKMTHCYECDKQVHELSNRSRCATCEHRRSIFNENLNDTLSARVAELEEEKLNMQISLTHVRESIGRISAFVENIEPRSHEAVITFNQCMKICATIDEMDLPEFEFKGGAK